MKKITLFILLIVGASFTGCEKYLNKTPESSGLSQKQVFSSYLKFRQFMDGMYADLNDYLDGNDQSLLAADCEEGFAESEWETMPVIQGGDWLRAYITAGANQFMPVWQNSWDGIRIADVCIQNIPFLKKNASTDQINQLNGQAHFMRAWFYFEILRRQGGMPYITKPLKPTDNFALPRLTYYETAKKIAADCDTAAKLLPIRWDQADYGRPTRGAAMALKATALLYAASPNNNQSNDVNKWKEAANASWAFISFAKSTGRYKLISSNAVDTVRYMTPGGVKMITYYGGGRDSIFMYNRVNDEIIWEDYQAVNISPYATFGPADLVPHSRLTGYSPSQNIVDKFETKNGLAIQDDPNYNPENPYVNRDPRFYESILFNGEQWTSVSNRYLQLYNGGKERTGAQYYSYTGYLSNKYWPSYVSVLTSATPPPTHTIYLRYAGLLLQYAEAANEVGGPNYKVSGASMSAVDAVNKVRARVHMPPVDSRYLTSKETFRKRIRNERAVELYLEHKRFFDLKRWHLSSGQKYKAIYGAHIVKDDSKPTGYNISRSATPVITLTFSPKQYRFPIPTTDANMFKAFKQNPGW